MQKSAKIQKSQWDMFCTASLQKKLINSVSNSDSDSALLQNESLKKAEALIQKQEAEVHVLFKLKVIVKDNVLQFVEQRNILYVFKFGHSFLKSNLG